MKPFVFEINGVIADRRKEAYLGGFARGEAAGIRRSAAAGILQRHGVPPLAVGNRSAALWAPEQRQQLLFVQVVAQPACRPRGARSAPGCCLVS